MELLKENKLNTINLRISIKSAYILKKIFSLMNKNIIKIE